MSDDYRSTLNELLPHADVTVCLRRVEPGEVPVLNVHTRVCFEAVTALVLATVRESVRLTKAEPLARPLIRGVLESLADEYDRELDGSSKSSERAVDGHHCT